MREQNVSTKTVVTVTEMARMVGLSRARFYQLVEAGVFPTPVYCVSSRRPMYVELQQEICLTVRRRNCGINGKPILFYSRGHRLPTPIVKTSKTPITKQKPTANHTELIDGLNALGLSVNSAKVSAAVAELFPTGLSGIDRGQVLRAVFLKIKASGSVG